MKRRDFINLAASSVIGWPLSARAQDPRRVIGVLGSVSDRSFPGGEEAFLQGLNEAGLSEGQNIGIERRWADGQYSRLRALASELVSRGVAVIVCVDAPAAFAAKAATTTIPVVFLTGADPIKTGLVDSFSRPSGNLTGVSILISGLLPKQLELLREMLPAAHRIALLVNPVNPNLQAYAPEAEAASQALGQRLQIVRADTEADIDAAFAAIQHQADALVVAADPFFIARREQVVALAARNAMPVIYPIRFFPEVGGLMSYGTPSTILYRQMANYAGRILRGAKPADLPIQQSTKIEIVINLKTAKALGLTVPPSVLVQADEVIE